MKDFKTSEISNLRRLKGIAITFIVVVNCAIIIFFLYQFHQTYKATTPNVSFFSGVIKVILLIELILLMAFSPLFFIINKRLRFTIKQLNDLNEAFTLVYKSYKDSVPRFFPIIPKYIISQKGLIVIGNLKNYILDAKQFDEISIRHVNLGRFGRKCFVTIRKDGTKITKFVYDTKYPNEVEFLKDNVWLVNENVSIIEN